MRNSASGTGGPPHTTPRKMVRSAERQIVYTMMSTATGKGIAAHQGYESSRETVPATPQ